MAMENQHFEVDLVIKSCEGIPRMDLVGHADPYIILTIVSPDGREKVHYRTAVAYNTKAPVWDELLMLRNVPLGTTCTFQVVDKDLLSPHDNIGSCRLVLDAATTAAARGAAATSSSFSSTASGSQPASLPPRPRPAAAPGPPAPATPARPSTFAATPRLGHCTLPPEWRPGSGAAVEREPEPPELRAGRGAEGGSTLRLEIEPAPGLRVPAGGCGCVVVQLSCRPSSGPRGPLLNFGPVRYRVSVSGLAGAVTGHVTDEGRRRYPAYKLQLVAVPHFFPGGAQLHWNTRHHNAAKVFTNPAAVVMVRGQHALLYSDSGKQTDRGVLHGGGDFVALLRGGVRAQQRRYFTYCIGGDGSMCLSETGRAVTTDGMSKHATHSSCAECVVYAGEFCLVPPPPPRGGSGTSPLVRSPRISSGSASNAAAVLTAAPPVPRSPIVSSNTTSTAAAIAAALTRSARSSRTPSPLPTPCARSSSDTGTSGAGTSDASAWLQPSLRVSSSMAITAAEAEAEAAHALRALDGVSGCCAPGWRLVVDNNSGTYAPPSDTLPALAALLTHNFPGLEVEAVAADDPRLAAYQARVPSRVVGGK